MRLLLAFSCLASTTNFTVSAPRAAISSTLFLYLSIQSTRWICMPTHLNGRPVGWLVA